MRLSQVLPVWSTVCELIRGSLWRLVYLLLLLWGSSYWSGNRKWIVTVHLMYYKVFYNSLAKHFQCRHNDHFDTVRSKVFSVPIAQYLYCGLRVDKNESKHHVCFQPSSWCCKHAFVFNNSSEVSKMAY